MVSRDLLYTLPTYVVGHTGCSLVYHHSPRDELAIRYGSVRV